MTPTTPQQRQPHPVSAPAAAGRVIVLAVPSKAIVTPRRVFRGDSRPPATIFESGFRVRADSTNTDIKEYGLRNVPSPWIGCTVRADLASGFPGRARGSTWIYEIEAPGRGIDVNRTLGYGYAFRAEREIIFPYDIPARRIVRAVWWSWGTPTDRVVANPVYRTPSVC
ncbi:hypothetical protein [Streptomyces sp. NPDC005017]|uniref:scabin-related ADP-ribosyltransferase n=1 Tax=Streptomyces sp. NPDC005017 TaxID=3364706 RepID=UPI0036CA8932